MLLKRQTGVGGITRTKDFGLFETMRQPYQDHQFYEWEVRLGF